MKRLLALSAFAFLTACGVDGPPIPPAQVPSETPEPGVTVSGKASIGIVGGNG